MRNYNNKEKEINILSSAKHFESKSIKPSCKYTKPITESESELEELRVTKEKNKFINFISELKQKLEFMCPTEYLDFAYTGRCMIGKEGFFDLRPYYKEIIKNSNTINFQTLLDNNYFHFNQYRLKNNNKYDYQWNSDIKEETGFDYRKEFKNNFMLEHNLVFIEINKLPIKEYILDSFDAYANIKIYGATYAKLKLREFAHNIKIKEIELDYVNNEEEPYFTLIGITNENPLFDLHNFILETDGQMYSMTGIMLNDFNYKVFAWTLFQSYYISWYKDYIILMGKHWHPNSIYKIEDITKLKYNPPSEDENN